MNTPAAHWQIYRHKIVRFNFAYARDSARARWLTGVPEDKKADLIPPGWFEAWADATFATDPVGAKQTPRYCAPLTG